MDRLECPNCGNLKANWNFDQKIWFCGVCNTYYNNFGMTIPQRNTTKTRFARVEYDGAVVTVKIDSAEQFLENFKRYMPVFCAPRVLKSITFYEEETR